MDKPTPTITTEQWYDHTEPGRRASRMKRAIDRIDQIKNGKPSLTRVQLRELADRLTDETGQ